MLQDLCSNFEWLSKSNKWDKQFDLSIGTPSISHFRIENNTYLRLSDILKAFAILKILNIPGMKCGSAEENLKRYGTPECDKADKRWDRQCTRRDIVALKVCFNTMQDWRHLYLKYF